MNQKFKRDGSNIHTSVSISFVDAILGTKIQLQSLTHTIAVVIPPGTQPNTVLRLKNQGLSVDSSKGDLFVTVQIEIPKELTDKQHELLKQWNS